MYTRPTIRPVMDVQVLLLLMMTWESTNASIKNTRHVFNDGMCESLTYQRHTDIFPQAESACTSQTHLRT
jgi:hypothetical protein